MIFLLADSIETSLENKPDTASVNIRRAEELLAYIRVHVRKGSDFVSRINGPLLTFPTSPGQEQEEKSYTQTDRMYVIGSLINRYHEDVVQIQLGVLNFLVRTPTLQPRHLEYLIGALRPTDGEVRNHDLGEIPESIWRNLSIERPVVQGMEETMIQLLAEKARP